MLKIMYVNVVMSKLSFIVHKTFIIVMLYVSYFEPVFLPEGRKVSFEISIFCGCVFFEC